MKRIVVLAAALLVLVCLVSAVIAAGWLLLSPGTMRPLVSIESPRHGERLALGEIVPIQSTARDQSKVTRVELWVDGNLENAENTSLPGGISPFPLSATWTPRAAGGHTLTVRAYNAQGQRGYASIDVEVVQNPDRDNDGVPDEMDACPDQPGSEAADGCPDRDNDQIRDADDACPDQPGVREAGGCPSPSATDRDGDGVLDGVDECPEQPGSAWAHGCPDRDGDGVPDAVDNCPDQPGSGEQTGCPGPPDLDGDGTADAVDACPEQAGPATSGGCPDRDGDQVRDAQDVCPETPGPQENAGCPVTDSGDRDNDGVSDGTDLAPDEAGTAESGGAPAPGEGSDLDGDSTSEEEETGDGQFLDVVDVIPLEDLVTIEFDALEFELSAEYPEGTPIFCYAGLGTGPQEQIGPFDSLGQRRWDVAEWSGGANSRRFAYMSSHTLPVHVECYARIRDLMGEDHLRYLGGYSHEHPALATNPQEYDGRIQNGPSEGGETGQSFQVAYRLCSPSCASAESRFGIADPGMSVPILRMERLLGRHILRWSMEGDISRVLAYHIFLGEQGLTVPFMQRSADITPFTPPCGSELEIYMTAVRYNSDGSVTESPRSNSVTWETPACPRQVRVTFLNLRTGELARDEEGRHWAGPILLSLQANESYVGSNAYGVIQGGHCAILSVSCWGIWLMPNSSYSIESIFDSIRARYADCYTNLCRRFYSAPDTTSVPLAVGADEDLTIRADIYEMDGPTNRNQSETVFYRSVVLRPAEITNTTRTLSDGNSELTVQIEVAGSP